MRVNDDYKACNAESQIKDETSVLAFWKRATRLRKSRDVLVRAISCPVRTVLTQNTRFMETSWN